MVLEPQKQVSLVQESERAVVLYRDGECFQVKVFGAGFQGCPLSFTSPRSRRERMKNLYLKGTLYPWLYERF